MSNKYLTVAQVAEKVGITTQAIYKQLHKQLQPYVVKVGNKTMLKNNVITDFYNMKLQELPTDTTAVAKIEQPSLQPLPTVTNLLIEEKDKQIELLKVELNKVREDKKIERDTLVQQLDSKEQQLQVKDEQIKDLNNRLEQALNNQSQDNYIMMAQQQNKMLDTAEVSKEDIEDKDEPQENIANIDAEVTETKQTKKFWSKIFSK